MLTPHDNRATPEGINSGFYLGKDLTFGIIRDGKLIVAQLTPTEARAVATALNTVAAQVEAQNKAVTN